MPHLFDPLTIGDLKFRNRSVMAPMTRNCADIQGVPPHMMATYYGQRSSAGLIVSESAPISTPAVGYPSWGVPGWRTCMSWRAT